MNQQDYRDYFVLGVVTCVTIAASVFLFWQPSSVKFATWSGLVATVAGWYHWLSISDDQRVDCGNVRAELPENGLAAEQRDWIGGENAGTSQTDPT